MKAIKILYRSFCFTSWSSLCFNVISNAKIIIIIIIIILIHYVYYYSQLLLPIITIIIVIIDKI